MQAAAARWDQDSKQHLILPQGQPLFGLDPGLNGHPAQQQQQEQSLPHHLQHNFTQMDAAFEQPYLDQPPRRGSAPSALPDLDAAQHLQPLEEAFPQLQQHHSLLLGQSGAHQQLQPPPQQQLRQGRQTWAPVRLRDQGA